MGCILYHAKSKNEKNIEIWNWLNNSNILLNQYIIRAGHCGRTRTSDPTFKKVSPLTNICFLSNI